MSAIGKNTDFAQEVLARGGLVAIPTETVYGLAANALNESAVLKVFEAKQRPFFDPLIIHLPSMQEVDNYAYFNEGPLKKLALKFWPGPLTLLLPKKSNIPDLVTSGLDQVAIRVPDHPLTLELLYKTNFPLAAPSANPFGYVSPTTAEHVNKQLGDKIDYILDGGPCSVGLESTIVGMESEKVCVYRLGGLSIEEIEKEIGPVEIKINMSSNPKAPGQLKSHYAPGKPLIIGNCNKLLSEHHGKKIATICFGTSNPGGSLMYNLSEKGDYKEAAINLFRVLRLIDETDCELILAELLPEIGLGRAINDRLRRAEAKN